MRQITRLNTNAHRHTPISPGGDRLGVPIYTYTRHNPMYTSVESSYSLYLQNQCTVRKQGDKWVYAHQLARSAADTSMRVPRCLFKTAWLCWMYQPSNLQRVVMC